LPECSDAESEAPPDAPSDAGDPPADWARIPAALVRNCDEDSETLLLSSWKISSSATEVDIEALEDRTDGDTLAAAE
jgi:hypothetical protein